MDLSRLQLLKTGLLQPTEATFLCYGAVYYMAAVVLLLCAIRWKRPESLEIVSPGRMLFAAAVTSLCVGTSLPLLYRLWPSNTPSDVWECDSVLLFFSAFADKWSIWDFTRYSVIHKPGVLAASAYTLFWGVPTYAVMQVFGWSTATFLSFSVILGLGSVLVGFWIARLLFNSGVAWCFFLIFAINPSLIFNMGYGVAQTGTLFALLVAILFTFRALLGKGPVWLNVILANLFLFGATLNYGPGRVFVVTVLMFLGGVVLAALIWRRISRRTALAAFSVLFITSTALIVENRFNRATDFTSMRGEHAFHQHYWKGNLTRLLGDTPEIQALDPNNLPTLIRVRFIFASALAGLEQFIHSFSPLPRLNPNWDRRGYSAGSEINPYQGGLIIFVIIGFLMTLRNSIVSLFFRGGHEKMSHWFVLALFFISLAPLSLVNRLDQHRSFIFVYPVSMWAALGLWACFQRIYANGTPRFIIGFLALTVSISLTLSPWRVFAAQEYPRRSLPEVIEHFSKVEPPAQVLGGAGLICQELAPLDFVMANINRAHPDVPQDYFHILFLSNFRDQYINANPGILQQYFEKYGSMRAAFVSNEPMVKFEKALRDRGLSVTRSQVGDYYSWIVEP